MTAPTPLAGHGFSVELPTAWEGRIFQRDAQEAAFAPNNRLQDTSGAPDAAPQGWPGETTRAVVHLANFALPAERGDYGSGAVEMMSSADTFVSLVEFGPELLGTPLYSASGIPRTEPRLFNPNGLQRRIEGQAGSQFFFTVNNRPLCLYVVIGSYADAVGLSARVNRVLEKIKVDAP